jgi:hypothetical protein
MKFLFAATCVCFAMSISPVLSQANPKRDKCLDEAEAKGLYTNPQRSRQSNKFNFAMKDQRQVFVRECMARK